MKDVTAAERSVGLRKVISLDDFTHPQSRFRNYISCGIASSATGWKYNGVLTLGHLLEAGKAEPKCEGVEGVIGESSNSAVRPEPIEHGH